MVGEVGALANGAPRGLPRLGRPAMFHCRLLDLLVIEVVDDSGRGVEGTAQGIVVAHVGQALCLGKCAELPVERLPPAAVSAPVDLVIEPVEFGMALVDPCEDARLIVTAQVEVLEPHEVADAPHAAHDGRHVGDAGEDRRDEARGADTRRMEGLHRREAPLDARGIFHLRAEPIVERVDGEAHARLRELPDEVKVAQHQVALGLDGEECTRPAQLLQKRPRAAELLLAGLVGVANRADEDLLARILLGMLDGRPELGVHEAPPRLRVPREALHEARIAVATGVRAPHIRVRREIADRQVGF